MIYASTDMDLQYKWFFINKVLLCYLGNIYEDHDISSLKIKSSLLLSSCPELSLAVPVANSLTFLCTLLTGKLLGEEFGGKRKGSIILVQEL